MLDNAKAPAEVRQDQGRGKEAQKRCTDQFSQRRAKRKNGNVWYKTGRFLWKHAPWDSTCFDTWVWFGEPLPRRCS
jgi:hypothetical protein